MMISTSLCPDGHAILNVVLTTAEHGRLPSSAFILDLDDYAPFPAPLGHLTVEVFDGSEFEMLVLLTDRGVIDDSTPLRVDWPDPPGDQPE